MSKIMTYKEAQLHINVLKSLKNWDECDEYVEKLQKTYGIFHILFVSNLSYVFVWGGDYTSDLQSVFTVVEEIIMPLYNVDHPIKLLEVWDDKILFKVLDLSK